MDFFAGLDISMDDTHVCVLDREGAVVPQLSQPIHSFEIIETMFARLGRLRMRRFPYESQTERAGLTLARS
jgi:hypothetical protein